MPNEGLKELYVAELKDLYSAENQLVKALPKLAKAASSEELRQGFVEHLEQTRGHVQLPTERSPSSPDCSNKTNTSLFWKRRCKKKRKLMRS